MPLYSAPYVRITLLMLFCKCPVNSLWFVLQWPCPITISKIFRKSRNLLLAPSGTEQQQKCKYIMVTGGAASGGRGSSPLPFFENGKKYPNFGEKNALIVFISYLKCCLKSIEEKKLQHFSLLRLPFLCCRWNVYVNNLFSRNLPCHEEFLVRPLVKKAALLWSCLLAAKNVFVHIQILSLLTLEKVHFDEMYWKWRLIWLTNYWVVRH